MPRPKRTDLDLINAAGLLHNAAEQDIGYLARFLTQASLPYRDPGDVPSWHRRNGNLELIVQPGVVVDEHGNGRSIGFPYGTVPRLVLSWLSTEAVRTKERELTLGDSLTDFMASLDMRPTGGRTGTITRLRIQMERLFQSTLTVKSVDTNRQRGARLSVASSFDLWWPSGTTDTQQPLLMPSRVRLSEEFFNEVTSHPVPLDLGALRVLRGSAMRLDIYAWLTYRMSYLSRRTTVPWDLLQQQFGNNLADTKQGRQQFKRDFINHLKQVRVVYPDAEIEASDTGLVMHPSKTHVRFRGMRALENPNAAAVE